MVLIKLRLKKVAYYISDVLISHVVLFDVFQVQNMSQSIEVLDQRTQRDVQFVEKMEIQLKGLENKFKQVENGHETNIARQFKVPPTS